MMGKRERNRVNGQIIRLHEKGVKRLQGLIEAKQLLIANINLELFRIRYHSLGCSLKLEYLRKSLSQATLQYESATVGN